MHAETEESKLVPATHVLQALFLWGMWGMWGEWRRGEREGEGEGERGIVDVRYEKRERENGKQRAKKERTKR